MIKKVLFLASVFLTANCATPELKEERGICRAIWLKEIPPRYEQETYYQTMSRQVPTGTTQCITRSYGSGLRTTCNAITATQYYKEQKERTVDRNEERRDARISECIVNNCSKKYGNNKCEV